MVKKPAEPSRDANPDPDWPNYFAEDLFGELVDRLRLEDDWQRHYIRNTIPWAAERYLRATTKASRARFPGRRKKLEKVERQAGKLRNLILDLDGMARIDFYTTATSYTGHPFTVDQQQPSDWLTEAGRYIRDVGVISGAAASDLKRQARPGGRPADAAARILIHDLATIYERATKRKAGRRGRFPKFVKLIAQAIDCKFEQIGVDHLVREVVGARKKLDEDD